MLISIWWSQLTINCKLFNNNLWESDKFTIAHFFEWETFDCMGCISEELVKQQIVLLGQGGKFILASNEIFVSFEDG